MSSDAAAAQGCPRQPLDYISGSHNMPREPGYSDAELTCIARMDPGVEDRSRGRAGSARRLGQLDAEIDERRMAAALENACVPADTRGPPGYKRFGEMAQAAAAGTFIIPIARTFRSSNGARHGAQHQRQGGWEVAARALKFPRNQI